MKKNRRSASKYIHGYDVVEQKRLRDQAAYLAPRVYPGIDFSRARHILEIGCGVGAQTKILLKRFPAVKIDAVDLSEDQLRVARHSLAREIKQGRVRFFRAHATDLSVLDRRDYDGAFLCWFLEHVPAPAKILREIRGRLRRGAVLYASEVFNRSFFASPESSVLENYWQHFNARQAELGGDPNIGPKLGTLLKAAGFRRIETELRSLLDDRRAPRARREFLDYFGHLVESGAPSLIAAGRVRAGSRTALRGEFRKLQRDPQTVIHLAFCRATARK